MKKKYLSYTGEIVDLDEKEFLDYPMNARLKLVEKEEIVKPLEKMTKDELNDYAASIGLYDVNQYMNKKEMIEKIKSFEGENNG